VGDELQVLDREVARAAVAGAAVVELAGLLPRERDELAQILRRDAFVHDEYRRHLGEERDRPEVLVRVVRQLLEHVGIHGERADMADDERIAVGVGPRDLFHGDVAAAAGLVLDHECWPRPLLISAEKARATIEELPPGAKGTTRRMGLEG